MTSVLTHAPSENGPGVHPFSFLQIHRTTSGIVNATYWAVIEMEKTALIAWDPPNTSAPSEIEPAAQNQTVLTGVLVKLFMWYSTPENGRAPSRALSTNVNLKSNSSRRICGEHIQSEGLTRRSEHLQEILAASLASALDRRNKEIYHARPHHVLHQNDE